jgi:PAS domain S-box-containing protein
MIAADCTILLIDDAQAGLEARRGTLETFGFLVLAATSGDEAMSLFRSHDVNVVVADHQLGASTTGGLASEMKLLKPHVPIISLSGTTQFEQPPPYADGVVAKGDGPEALVAVIAQVMAANKIGNRQPSPRQSNPCSSAPLPAQALLAAIVEDSSDAILSKDMGGIVTSWNHSAEIMYGYERVEMIGRSVETLLPADRPNEVRHILSRLQRGERIFHFETVRVRKSGRKLDVALTISPIRDEQGRVIGASTIARDITDQRKAEEALQKAEKLSLLGRTAATVVHEINNPLEAIGNLLFLLGKSAELNPQDRGYVELARQEIQRVSQITRLSLGLQRGGVSARPQSLLVTELLDSILVLYQSRARKLGVAIERRYRDRGEMLGIAGELRQVFFNLMVNATDALTATGDKIVLGVRRAIRWDTGQKGVRVSIMDNGPGIPPEIRAQLFEAFYTTKGEQGTGIGLWVSRSIVEKHGGKISMRSSVRPGCSGTCFSIFLPLSGMPRMIEISDRSSKHPEV